MEYLIFKTLALAISASIIIWYNMKRKGKKLKENKANPIELEDGGYAIEKPDEEYLTGIDAEVNLDVNFKSSSSEARPPDPKGKPTIRPR